jgi:hypothetical protein
MRGLLGEGRQAPCRQAADHHDQPRPPLRRQVGPGRRSRGDRLGHLAWPSSRPARAKRSRSRPALRRNPPHLQRFHRHGSWLDAKRLEEGGFRWPKVEDGVVRLTAAELQALLEGLDWTRVHAPRQITMPVAAS